MKNYCNHFPLPIDPKNYESSVETNYNVCFAIKIAGLMVKKSLAFREITSSIHIIIESLNINPSLWETFKSKVV